jgi:predicted nucleotidyltransferase
VTVGLSDEPALGSRPLSSALTAIVEIALLSVEESSGVGIDIGKSRDALAEICRRHRVKRLQLFGSTAAGHDRPDDSDLDFLVEFESVPEGEYADTYFGLREALEHLYGRPVDLVVDSAIRNPYFRESVERTKTLLYAA